MITGNDLIKLGYKPAPWFGDALKKLNGGITPYPPSEKHIRYICDQLLPPPVLEKHKWARPYFMNIDASNEEEQANIDGVVASMEEIMKVPTVLDGAVMPDACPTGGKHIPVGAVVRTENAIHPAWHSADMCCSVYATNFGNKDPKEVLDAAHSITHFGAGGRKGIKDFGHILTDNKSLYDRIMSNYYTKDYIEKACRHLGTQGDGNHFLYVGISENTGETVMVTHHGSRGFGASVYKKGLNEAEKFRRRLAPSVDKINAWLPYGELEGDLYWEAIQIIREWTKLNHGVLHNKTLNAVKTAGNGSFWNEHNSVFKDGDSFYHAKGATPMLDKFVPDSTDGLRLIPLNMSQPILVVRGGGSVNGIGFAPHGAGRNVSRAAHRKKHEGRSNEEIFAEETAGLDVRFFSGNIDITELPSAYKNAEQVQAQIKQYGLGEVVDRILPYGCIMAGDWKKNFKWK